jgi:branched-chain amino acid aminotransferase
MLEDSFVYLNGEFIAWDQAKIHIMSHSLGRGSAIFEFLGLHDTQTGPAVFRVDKHIDRLFKSAVLVNMEIPLTKEQLKTAIFKTIIKNKVKQGFLKILVYYPQISFDVMPPEGKPSISIFVIEFQEDLTMSKLTDKNLPTMCISSWRKLDPATVPIEAKVAANYLNSMIARLDARKRGYNFALLLDSKGFIAEGGTESIFLVKNGRLMTPALGTILDSITRMSILEVARRSGIESVEGKFPPDIIYESEEIFLSGTPIKVQSVKRVENHEFSPAPGPVTKKMSQLIRNILSGEDKRFKDWFFQVE